MIHILQFEVVDDDIELEHLDGVEVEVEVAAHREVRLNDDLNDETELAVGNTVLDEVVYVALDATLQLTDETDEMVCVYLCID